MAIPLRTRPFAVFRQHFRLALMSLGAALMLGSFIWQAGKLIALINQVPQNNVALSAQATAPLPGATPNTALLSLFGSPPKQSAPPPDAALPASSLNLQVSAIFYASPPGVSSVIIEESNKPLLLHPGEEIRQGVVLADIAPNRITLKRNERFEQITFRNIDTAMIGLVGKGDPPTSSPGTSADIAQTPPTSPGSASTGTLPPAYQQLIQRQLAQKNSAQ